MSRQINQPINQVRLTNVAIIRFNKAGKRFEIACYRNKILDYRTGLETDLTEVLQTDRIFTNVSKGQFAKASDLKKAFDTSDEEEIAKIILEKGNSVQVSDLERQQQLQNTLSQVATWVATTACTPLAVVHIPCDKSNTTWSTITQCSRTRQSRNNILDAVKFLKTVIPIERAKMELSLQYPDASEGLVHEELERLQAIIISTKALNDRTTIALHVDPSTYRELDELAQKVQGRLDIIEQVVQQACDVDLEVELERRHDVIGGTMSPAEPLDSSDNEAAPLIEKLQAVRLAAQEHIDHDDSATSDEETLMSKKERQKRQKKSKKLTRREWNDEPTKIIHNTVSSVKDTAQGGRVAESAGVEACASQAGGKSCNSCGGSFSGAEYRAHFRSDWHRFNQKLKLKGVAPISEQEFLLCDAETFFGSDN